MLFCCIKNKSVADGTFSRFFFFLSGNRKISCRVYCLVTFLVRFVHLSCLLSNTLVLSLSQIELEEQRRTGRGRAKDSKRKRKSHRGGNGEGAGERSLDASESKKTCTLSHSPSPHLPVQTHPEVTVRLSCFWFKHVYDLLIVWKL